MNVKGEELEDTKGVISENESSNGFCTKVSINLIHV